jgi:hypothetical protein
VEVFQLSQWLPLSNSSSDVHFVELIESTAYQKPFELVEDKRLSKFAGHSQSISSFLRYGLLQVGNSPPLDKKMELPPLHVDSSL